MSNSQPVHARSVFYNNGFLIIDSADQRVQVPCDLRSETAKKNLTTLFHRKSGVDLYLDETGELREATNCLGRFKAWWQGPEKVKEVVTATLAEFSTFLATIEDERISRVAVETLFSKAGAVGSLSPQIFDRAAFKKADKLSELLLERNVIRLKIGDAGFFDVKCKDKDIQHIQGGQILDIDLGDEKVNQNFLSFLSREKGKKFGLPIEQIHQEAMRIFTHLEVFLGQVETTKVHKVAIKRIVESGSFHRLNDYLFRKTLEFNRVNETLIKAGLLQKRETPFAHILENSLIEQCVSPKYSAAKARFKNALFDIRNNGTNAIRERELEESLIALVVKEFRFSQKLGVDLERVSDGGSGGARYARNRFGRKVLVVKPGDEGPHGDNNPQWYAPLKRFFIPQKGSLYGNSEPLAEVESWLLDRKFGLNVVPPTQLRYIKSKQFNGKVEKECSVQMFVSGCEKTLGDIAGVSPKMYRLPRPILRWWLGRNEEELLEVIPAGLLERAACEDALTGNTDCHFGNILTKKKQAGDAPTLIEKLFSEKHRDVTDQEINDFVASFFRDGHEQTMLEALLHSEINGKRERVWTIKHDGGSSCGHSQPSGYLSLCYKYLFEVLPHFKAPFTMQKTFVGNDYQFARGVMESTIQAVRNILLPEWFEKFWKLEENRQLLKEWMFEQGYSRKNELSLELNRRLRIASGMKCVEKTDPEYSRYLKYFNYHLNRIHNNVDTRFQNWRVLKKYLEKAHSDKSPAILKKKESMRYFFNNVRSESDIHRELFSAENDPFYRQTEEWKLEKVKAGDSEYKSTRNLSTAVLLEDFSPSAPLDAGEVILE